MSFHLSSYQLRPAFPLLHASWAAPARYATLRTGQHPSFPPPFQLVLVCGRKKARFGKAADRENKRRKSLLFCASFLSPISFSTFSGGRSAHSHCNVPENRKSTRRQRKINTWCCSPPSPPRKANTSGRGSVENWQEICNQLSWMLNLKIRKKVFKILHFKINLLQFNFKVLEQNSTHDLFWHD